MWCFLFILITSITFFVFFFSCWRSRGRWKPPQRAPCDFLSPRTPRKYPSPIPRPVLSKHRATLVMCSPCSPAPGLVHLWLACGSDTSLGTLCSPAWCLDLHCSRDCSHVVCTQAAPTAHKMTGPRGHVKNDGNIRPLLAFASCPSLQMSDIVFCSPCHPHN